MIIRWFLNSSRTTSLQDLECQGHYSDGGTHFCNKPFETLLAKYGVKHKVATPYHPQTSGQVETAYKTILGMSPIALFMAKRVIFQWIEYKAWWAIKKLNMDLTRAGLKRCLDLNELEEMRNDATSIQKLQKQGKLKSRWTGPFIIHEVHPNGVVEVFNPKAIKPSKSMAIVSSHS
ncbi:hypothetical protein CK203_100669 [Vitis vinifera]|uniref:Integrase catalytic domain-containing protein n=1 Tax=Vitis vinifera TaxID=29760 RepID=A0A438D6G4_VITVI|nr:hypothetical protein CK203_100669 [Vitis vinifera]